MRENIEQRACELAVYIIETHATVRAAAKSIALPSIALFLLCMRGAAPLAYAAIPWALDIPDDPDAQFYAWATQKSVAYLRFFLRMLPVIAIFILP